MQILSAVFRYRNAESPDKLGLYPERCHIKAFPERRYLWTSRLLAIWAAINICITIVLTMVIYLLIPSRGVRPLLYEINNSALHKVMPLTIQANSQKLLTESLITEYVKLRHTLPKSRVMLQYQWDEKSIFHAYSDNKIYETFKQQIDMEKLTKYVRSGIKREVEIDEVTNIIGNLYIVRFRTITTMPDEEKPNVSLWNAYLRVGYIQWPQTNLPADYLLNPYGFKILSYDFGYLGKETTSQP